MKTLFLILLWNAGVVSADVDQASLRKLTDQLGSTFWSPPEKRLVRTTIYKKGKGASDSGSKSCQSNEKIGLRYATAKEAGTLGVPHWLPRGSTVKIQTKQGVYSYIAADEGGGVAAKESGKTNEQKAAPVLDFCAAEQLWPDFVIVGVTITQEKFLQRLDTRMSENAVRLRDGIRHQARVIHGAIECEDAGCPIVERQLTEATAASWHRVDSPGVSRLYLHARPSMDLRFRVDAVTRAAREGHAGTNHESCHRQEDQVRNDFHAPGRWQVRTDLSSANEKHSPRIEQS